MPFVVTFLTLVGVGSARADLTVVTQVTSSGQGQAGTRTITNRYRGNLVRSESQGRVQILDTKTGKLTILDPKAKTYRVAKMNDLISGHSSMKRGPMTVKGSIKPTGEVKKILGRTANRYQGNISVETDRGKMQMTMVQWASPSLKTPGNLALSLTNMSGGVPILGTSKELTKEMSKIQGYPLESSVVLNSRLGSSAPNGRVIKLNSKVVRFEEKALSASLFQVPSGYKQIQPKRGPLKPVKVDHDH